MGYVKTFEDARVELDMFDTRPVSRSSFYIFWNKVPHRDETAYRKGGRRLQNAVADSLDPRDRALMSKPAFTVAHKCVSGRII